MPKPESLAAYLVRVRLESMAAKMERKGTDYQVRTIRQNVIPGTAVTVEAQLVLGVKLQ